MASQRTCSPPMTRARRAHEAASSDRLPTELLSDEAASYDRLPTELLSDILLRLPAKDLCRLRAVCSSWRTVTTDADFITAHADRHKEPLFVAKFWDDDRHIYVLNLSGNVVKPIAGAYIGHQLMRTRLNQACLATQRNTCCVLNPATGGINQVLPQVPMLYHRTFFTLGLVVSTGEYKLLRYLSIFNVSGQKQFSGVQVLTIIGGADPTQWRPRQDPPLSIDLHSSVVVDGVVYFLKGLSEYRRVPADYILSFDLAREEWREILLGPSSTGNLTSGRMFTNELTLADVNGSLVLAHHPSRLPIMDLWFLVDFESRLWVRQYSIRTELVATSLTFGCHLIPLMALDDGRLVIHLAPTGILFICDPGTNTFTRVDIRHRLDSIAVYTGNLLG